MIDHPQIRELRELLTAFVERPLPGALVLGCHDTDMLYVVHTLDTLDVDSPADRFLLYFEPFLTAASYVARLVSHVATVTASAPVPPAEPLPRMNALMAAQVAVLPPGDHRLIVALLPRQIADPVSFSALADDLLTSPHAERLRLVLRDDLGNPRHLLSAEANPSKQIIGYRFHLPVTALVESTTVAARDDNADPDVRAQSFLQLATISLAQGRHTDAVSACKAAIALTDTPVLLALALAFHADALRAQGNLETALVSASTALEHAASCGASPVMHHAAMTLGELSHDLGHHDDAIACFALAERTAPHPQIRAHACERRLSLVETKSVC